jgi:hypothetical protein
MDLFTSATVLHCSMLTSTICKIVSWFFICTNIVGHCSLRMLQHLFRNSLSFQHVLCTSAHWRNFSAEYCVRITTKHCQIVCCKHTQGHHVTLPGVSGMSQCVLVLNFRGLKRCIVTVCLLRELDTPTVFLPCSLVGPPHKGE